LILSFFAGVGALGAPRGYNNFDNGQVNEASFMLAAQYVSDVLLPFGYDTVTVDGGYAINGSDLITDGFGRPYPRLDLFPSASDGRGFRTLSEKVHALGLKLGVWINRGISNSAYYSNLPVFNSSYHAKDVAITTNDCVWAPYFMGTNAPSSASTDWYRSIAQWWLDQGIDFVKA